MSCDWEGNRRSGVALRHMRHRLKWFIHLRAQGLSKGDEHPTNTPRGVSYSLPLVPSYAAAVNQFVKDGPRGLGTRPPIFGPGALSRVSPYLRSQVKSRCLFLLISWHFISPRRIFYFNVDREASASGWLPSLRLPDVRQPWRQIDACLLSFHASFHSFLSLSLLSVALIPRESTPGYLRLVRRLQWVRCACSRVCGKTQTEFNSVCRVENKVIASTRTERGLDGSVTILSGPTARHLLLGSSTTRSLYVHGLWKFPEFVQDTDLCQSTSRMLCSTLVSWFDQGHWVHCAAQIQRRATKPG